MSRFLFQCPRANTQLPQRHVAIGHNLWAQLGSPIIIRILLPRGLGRTRALCQDSCACTWRVVNGTGTVRRVLVRQLKQDRKIGLRARQFSRNYDSLPQKLLPGNILTWKIKYIIMCFCFRLKYLNSKILYKKNCKVHLKFIRGIYFLKLFNFGGGNCCN